MLTSKSFDLSRSFTGVSTVERLKDFGERPLFCRTPSEGPSWILWMGHVSNSKPIFVPLASIARQA